ncbi:MAG TPA: translation initiation factor IF-2, partial [Rhodothermales bacterium]
KDAKRKRKRKRKRKTDAPATPGETPVKVQPAAREADTARKKKKKRGPAVDEADVTQTLQETLRELEQGASRMRQRRRRQRRDERAAQRQTDAEREEAESTRLRVTEFVSTGELANLMDVPVSELIRTLFSAGMMVSINQRLDADTISFLADEYGMEVEFIKEFGTDDIILEEDRPEDLQPRAPVVTVMGHVDHGKTSLLDYIRRANVVAGEAGGITQHIGAYHVVTDDNRTMTFLDTPGHEAFTAMRARGAQATDVVILVVAADDAVMPQTIEAINHARAAEVPIVVAINKIDKPNANAQRVMQQLADQNVLVEQYGGKVQCALVSAHTGEGVQDLLDKVLLEAELQELKANPSRPADGIVIESRLEKGRGNVSTVLVQNGTLRVGDTFIAGIHSGRVRAMFDERENRIEEVGPARPALVLGFDGAAEVGDTFIVLRDEREAREIAQRRQQIHREQTLRQRKHITLDEIGRRLALGDFRELNLIIKADVGGSVEALADSLLKLSTSEVAVSIIHSGVGAITESDVMLASASDAVIIGFNVRPMAGARQLAEREEIDIRMYSIIYNAIEDVRDALEGLLSPEESERTIGAAEVRETFKVPKAGMVAGCYIVEGRIHRNDRIRIVRDGVVIYTGGIASLRRFKEDVREVTSGYECGISIENYNDLKVGDQIEAFEIVETKRTLEV